ncbi:ATP-binding cassette domain-containing protein [Paenibacillus campinasensis]|uniref:ATP-binding cassette domain-containing protein n=1 Tax=Paenibacillus campinasensis TaxID=66347 RepID=A0ABW9T5H2_9BACL|nr:ABC transporter ATP-binding protein [Paenibacillus campinasensis]MUG68354.1 ATP-binding cassette domain-containing protein [Paenibacillus campinasensis]
MTRKKSIARLLEIAGEKKGLLLIASLLSSIGAICMLVPYASVYYILKELLVNAASPVLADGAKMIRLGVIALLGFVAGLFIMFAGGMSSHFAAFRILYGLRIKLSEHIGRLPLGWLNRNSTGAVRNTLEQNVEKVEVFIAHQMPDFVQAIVTVVLMITVMFTLNVWLAIACVIPIALGFVIQIALISGSKTRENLKHCYDALERMNASAIQYVRGMPAVKVFGQTVQTFRQFYHDMIRYRDYGVKLTNQFQHGSLIFKVMLSSLVAFILPVGIVLLSRNPNDAAFVSVLLFFLVMAPSLSASLSKIIFLAETIRDVHESVERMDRILDESYVPEPEHPKRPDSFDVTFDHVHFSYGTESTQALIDISFTARQGEVTALVGPSGAGKSTIANLVPRFWDVNSGSIRIGEVDIRNIETPKLMDTVAFVFQESFLFRDTIYNNIAVGRPDAKPDDVYAAAKAAQCHAFIENLPLEYDTLIGEAGVYLSGGEVQRITVARALLKNAPILVLDESTAFADPENEFEMKLALKALMKNKTVIVIAHRLSTIQDADQILVMENGNIVKRGMHEELIATGGLYRRLWHSYRDASQWHLGRGKGDTEHDEHATQHYGG